MIRYIRKHLYKIICLAPLVAFLVAFTAVPIVRVFILSLTDADGTALTLGNYLELIRQAEFRGAFLNTLVVALGSLAIEIGAGLLLALVLSARPAFGGVARSLFMLPLAIPTVVSAVMMSYLFSTSGWINRILEDLGLISRPVAWLQGGWTSLFTVIVADSWKVTPLVMMILLAGLQSIDRQLYKAARIDGAGALYCFRRITLPLLMPSLTAAVIIRGIDAFRIFSLALVLMGENLKVIGTYAYLEYTAYHNRHLSAAAAVVLFLLIMLAVAAYIRCVGRKGLQPT